MDYSSEPRLVFTPLSENDYCDFYDLEMNSFDEDADFYLKFIENKHKILELGCGSGRLTRILAQHCKHITGLDLSVQMLDKARLHKTDNISYCLSDMRDFSLNSLFDIIIIPYNTLNLLLSAQQVKKCLQLCRKYLKKTGQLLFQVFHPNNKFKQLEGEKIFQFAIFKRDNGDTLVKETIRSYSSKRCMTTLVERYRDRPIISNSPNRDLQHSIELFTPKLSKWQEITKQCDFQIESCFGEYNFTSFSEENDSTLLIHAFPYHH